jgi:hypothetical protein
MIEALKVRFALYLLSQGNPVEALEELSTIPPDARSHPDYGSAMSQALAASLEFWQQALCRAETIAAAQPDDPQANQYLRYCQSRLVASKDEARAWLKRSRSADDAKTESEATPCGIA